MASNKVGLLIEQGATFSALIVLSGDLGNTAWTTRSQMRKHFQSSNYYVINTNLSGANLTLSLTASESANITAGRYVYDVEMIDEANNVYRILEGNITVTPEVTR